MNIPNVNQANYYPTRFKPVNLNLSLAHPCFLSSNAYPYFLSDTSREKDQTFWLLFLLKKYRSFKISAQKGFTLLELLITVLIIGILTAMSLPSYISVVDKSKYGDAKVQMNQMGKELITFNLENNYYPADVSRDIVPKDNNNQPAINSFVRQSSGKIPFNSKYDYENWAASGEGSNTCLIQITFLGKNVEKEATNGYNSAYKQAGMYQVSNGDDMLLSLGLAPCN